MRIQLSLIGGLLAALLAGPAEASSDSAFLETMGAPREDPTFSCAEIEPLERGKFKKCRVRWITIELDEIIAEIDRIRTERIEQERNAVWDWLYATPVEDCDAVPEIEIAKFPFCAFTNGDQGLTLLSRHENGLSQLRTIRDQLADQLAELQTRLDTLKERERAQINLFDEPPAAQLEPLLARLRTLDDQVQLMETLGRAQLAAASLQRPVIALRMTQAPEAAQLRNSASGTANVVASVQQGEHLIVIVTDNSQSEFIPVVHRVSGFGYVARTDLEQ